jgi:translation elongation factor EF-G
METPAAPWPLLQCVIEPKSQADHAKLHAALSRLADADASLGVKTDEEAGQTIVGGTSEHHLDRIIDRLRSDFLVDVTVGALQVAYRETIIRTHEQDCTHKRLFRGEGQFARVRILFEPNPDSTDLAFESAIAKGALPKVYVVGVEKGLRTVGSSGPLAGFPIIGVKATLVDGAYHDVDSSVLAFEIAGRACFRDAAPRLEMQLLEPIMKVEVAAPEKYRRNVVGELHSRRGEIRGQETRGGIMVVNAMLPLANMFKLDDALRSLSEGQAVLTVGYAGYRPVPFPDDRDPPPAMAMRA